MLICQFGLSHLQNSCFKALSCLRIPCLSIHLIRKTQSGSPIRQYLQSLKPGAYNCTSSPRLRQAKFYLLWRRGRKQRLK